MQCVYSNIKKQCNVFIQAFKHKETMQCVYSDIQTLINNAMCLF